MAHGTEATPLPREHAEAHHAAQLPAALAAQRAIQAEIDRFLTAMSPLVADFNAANAAVKQARRAVDGDAAGLPIAPAGGKYSAIMATYARLAALHGSGLVAPSPV